MALVPIFFDFSWLTATFPQKAFLAYLKRMHAIELWTYFKFMKFNLLGNYESRKDGTYWLSVNDVVVIARQTRNMLEESLVAEFSSTREVENPRHLQEPAEKKLRPQRHEDPDIWLVQTFAIHICDQLRSAIIAFGACRKQKKKKNIL
jgi:hypothetical protein